MTIDGVVNKSFLLFLILVVSATVTWRQALQGLPSWFGIALILSLIGALIVAFIIIFKPQLAPRLAWLYAALEGVLIGTVSVTAEQAFPGIVVQAVSLTFGALAAMLFLYKARIIKVTRGFRTGLTVAIGAIVLVYLLSWIVGWFGVNTSMFYDNSTFSIIFSLVVVGVASLSLLLDFDLIERGAGKAPKYMEWYAAFGLMITLIWLYLELLRLLSKLRSRD